MANQNLEKAIKDFAKILQESLHEHFSFRLYVAGTSKKSSKAIMNIKNFCEKYLKGRYELEVMDIYQQPKSWAGMQCSETFRVWFLRFHFL